MAVPEVNKNLLRELEAMGFSEARATKAIHYSGNSSIEAAINWIIDHEDDADIDEMPLERIRAGKELLEAKRIAEENERKRYIAQQKGKKEEERRARERIRQKLQQDKAERRGRLGLPMEVKRTACSLHEGENFVPVKFAALSDESSSKLELLRECLISLKRQHMGNEAQVKRAFQTLLIYVRNVANYPEEGKFRRIRLSNPAFQSRVGNCSEGIKFLELCGFQRVGGGEFLLLPREKVDMALLKAGCTLLNSAITNPFFGLLSRKVDTMNGD